MWQSMIEGKMAPNNLQVFSAVRTCAFAASLLGTCVAGAVLSFPQTAFSGGEATKINESGTYVRTMVPQEDLNGLRPPKARIEGGTRGRGSQGLLVLPLVPDHVGLTIASQPDLYWYLSKPTASKVMFVLVDTRSIGVVHQLTLAAQPGVQAIRFKDVGITLEPNVLYRWYVDVVLDIDVPSRDIVSGGMIQRIEPTFSTSDLATLSSIEAVQFYAQQGLWYDALGSISQLIALAPNDPVLRRQRASLLEQVGLQEVSEWDKLQAATDGMLK